jgi:voltage-gated potassium channel
MKLVSTQLSYLLTQHETRQNLRALAKYVIFLIAVIAAYSAAFHWIMIEVEGHRHSWITGVYWTLTVMSTLGFGDITFQSDLGRTFSVLVLMSGVVLLLIVLPFAFIRFFYAPWLEAQIRLRAPRALPPGTRGHVVVCRDDAIFRGLMARLAPLGIPCQVIEPDLARAAELYGEGVPVVVGDVDSVATFAAVRVEDALAVVANLGDAINTNVTLTVREAAATAQVIAFVDEEDSVDLLELAGADHVVPLKRRLGEHLAGRVRAGHSQTHVVGRFGDLLLAEFPVHQTPFARRTIRDIGLRPALGINILGVWERGRLLPASPDLTLTDSSVPVVLATEDQLLELDTLLVIYDLNESPVLVIGGGKVGTATARALRARGVAVHLIERDPEVAARVEGVADRLFVGDAAAREVLHEAGIAEAPSVVLTTHDDATNIYLTVYCRRLAPGLRIVSRIEHPRNVEAIHRAGADFALSYATLGVESVLSLLRGRELLMLGEGVEFYTLAMPKKLAGRTLAETEVGRRTGLNVVALQQPDGTVELALPDSPLPADASLLALGSAEARERFENELA